MINLYIRFLENKMGSPCSRGLVTLNDTCRLLTYEKQNYSFLKHEKKSLCTRIVIWLQGEIKYFPAFKIPKLTNSWDQHAFPIAWLHRNAKSVFEWSKTFFTTLYIKTQKYFRALATTLRGESLCTVLFLDVLGFNINFNVFL